MLSASAADEPALDEVQVSRAHRRFHVTSRGKQGMTSHQMSAAYRIDLRAYVAWLDDEGLAIAEVSEEDVTRYVGHLAGLGKKAASTKRAQVAVRGLHRFIA